MNPRESDPEFFDAPYAFRELLDSKSSYPPGYILEEFDYLAAQAARESARLAQQQAEAEAAQFEEPSSKKEAQADIKNSILKLRGKIALLVLLLIPPSF